MAAVRRQQQQGNTGSMAAVVPPTLVASSSSSCSPPKGRHYNLRSKCRRQQQGNTRSMAAVVPLAASSSWSCSPPEDRHYILRSKRLRRDCAKMSRDREQLQNKLNDLRVYLSRDSANWDAEQLQNKVNDLRAYTVPRDRANWDADMLRNILNELRAYIKSCRTKAERAKVFQILREDGYSETDEYFIQAITICTNAVHRKVFLGLKTKEGRVNYVKVSWDDMMTQKSKNKGPFGQASEDSGSSSYY